MRFLLIILALLFAISCDAPKSETSNPLDINFERDLILKKGISQQKLIEVGLDTASNYRWKRIRTIRFYNKEGLVSHEIRPEYFWDERVANPIRSEKILASKNLENSLLMGQTNIPTGRADTIFYQYDSKNNLILESDNLGKTTYSYDEKGNCVERCYNSNRLEITCSYYIYQYDENAKIISRLDSLGPMSNRGASSSKKVTYEYDQKGRKTFDGRIRQSFNSHGQLLMLQTSYSRTVFAYNEEGFKVQETRTTGLTNKVPWITNAYFYYDDKGLLIETKVLDENNKLIELMNYEYKF